MRLVFVFGGGMIQQSGSLCKYDEILSRQCNSLCHLCRLLRATCIATPPRYGPCKRKCKITDKIPASSSSSFIYPHAPDDIQRCLRMESFILLQNEWYKEPGKYKFGKKQRKSLSNSCSYADYGKSRWAMSITKFPIFSQNQ